MDDSKNILILGADKEQRSTTIKTYKTMRKIEEQMVAAVRNHKNFRCTNTEVEVEGKYIYVYLHNNLIYAKNTKNGKQMFKNCGWLTSTTKSRLNALGANIYQKNWHWYDATTNKEWKNGKLEDIG